MIELSTDGTCWTINTAGIFKVPYERNRKKCITAMLRLNSQPKLLKINGYRAKQHRKRGCFCARGGKIFSRARNIKYVFPAVLLF